MGIVAQGVNCAMGWFSRLVRSVVLWPVRAKMCVNARGACGEVLGRASE